MVFKIVKIVFFTILISKVAYSKGLSTQFDLSFFGIQNDGVHKCSIIQNDGIVTVNYEVDLGLNKARSKWTEVEKSYSLNNAFQEGEKILIQDRTSKISIDTAERSAKSYQVTHGKQHYFKTIFCSNK